METSDGREFKVLHSCPDSCPPDQQLFTAHKSDALSFFLSLLTSQSHLSVVSPILWDITFAHQLLM